MGAICSTSMSLTKIGFAEEAAEKKYAEGSSAVAQLSEAQIEQFRDAFSRFDKDGGGSIDSTELESLLHALGQFPNQDELDAMIKLADVDGSGDIDFFEFVVLMAHKMTDDKPENNEEKLLEAFKVFDADGSGDIDASEMRYIMYNLGQKMSLQQIDSVIRTFDTDGDGSLSFEEFSAALTQQKLFGSSALSDDFLGHGIQHSDDAAAAPTAGATALSPRPPSVSIAGDDVTPFTPVPLSTAAKTPISPASAQIRAAFEVFDTDGNGTLSADELKAILTRPVNGRPSKFSEADVEALILKYDANGDGVLSMEEFADAWGGLVEIGALGAVTPAASPNPASR